MKQRLLLSLLMLMVSVGVSWAQSYDIKVTFPANATKAITVSANVADDKALYGGAGSTTNNKVLTIPAEGNTSGAISITAAGATEITFGGEIQTIEINNDQLEVICKVGEDKYQKHFLRMTTEVTYTVEQLDYSEVSKYDYEITFKPEAIVPIKIKTED